MSSIESVREDRNNELGCISGEGESEERLMPEVDYLKNTRLFRMFTRAELKRASAFLEPIKCAKGHLVIHEGSSGSSIYLVKSGELRVSHVVRGKKRDLATFRTGDHFGEVSFVDGRPRSATIYATEDSELLVISRAAFNSLQSQDPKLQIKFMHALLEDLCEKLRGRNDTLDFDLSDLLPVGIFEIEERGLITFANRNGLQSFGYSERDFEKGLNFFELLVPGERDKAQEKVATIFQGKNIGAEEYQLMSRDGRIIPVALQWDVLSRGNRVTGLRATLLDITERKIIEEDLRRARDELEIRVRERTAELQESEERYALAVRGANDGVWDWNLTADEIYFSPRWKGMLGFEEGELSNSPSEWLERIHPADADTVRKGVVIHCQGLTQHFETEYRILAKDGSYRWMLCRGLAVRDSEGRAYRIAGSQTDITDRKNMEQQLLQNAFYDSLTGLPNRALFMDRLSQSLDRMRKRRKYLFAVVYLDLDRFKLVNDSLGHVLGDQLLVLVAQRLNSSVRPGDTVARLGGDEFAILLDEIRDLSDPIRVARRIQNSFLSAFALASREVFITASIGIAFSSREPLAEAGKMGLFSLEPGEKALRVKSSEIEYERPEDLLRDADIAMYQAKSKGKACYEVFDSTMHARACQSLQLETDLRLGIERQEYEIHYQPIISLKTGRLSGFETLLRWKHPQRGLVSPAEFIPATEENGLIIPIGRHVLFLACKQLKKWLTQFRSEQPLFISVNVSARQLLHGNFLEQVKQVLRETGLDPTCLKLEITESVMMENQESTISILPKLNELGIELSLDDFGTGYSSLSALHRFPIDNLKVDGSFVRGMSLSEENLQIVSTIIGLARNLDMTVVAEGVEDISDLIQLRALKCDYAQGFQISRPLDTEAATEMIARHPRW